MTLPVRNSIGSFPSYLWLSEATIINRLISECLDRGFTISVFDGLEWPVMRSADRAEIQKNIGTTDMTQLLVRDQNGNEVLWCLLVHGNWSDVIADHTDSHLANEIMEAIEPTVQRFEGKRE